MAGAPAWVDDLDVHAGPPEASMGTRALDDARWLLVDDDWVAQRRRARDLLATRRGAVMVGAADDAARELGARLDGWLAARHPEVVDDAHGCERDPMVAARMRVAEDLCLLVPDADSGRWLLAAGAVCFPSYWRLHDKVGLPLAGVHDPVPGYAGPLAGRVDTFLARLRPGQGVWRRNWSIHDSPELFVPVHDGPSTLPTPAERWLRSEYQTLVRVEQADAVVFTIRTQQAPIHQLVARPDICAALAGAVRGWTPAQRAYKGAAVDDALLHWLDASAVRGVPP